MPLSDDLIGASATFPAPLRPQKDGSLAMEALLAERKVFLSKKKLTYKCTVRADDDARTVRFWEMLVEKGSGISSGGDLDGISPGIGFKKTTFKTSGKERSGGIEEASTLFGKDYSYQWDYAAVRTALRGIAETQGYGFETVLRAKAV